MAHCFKRHCVPPAAARLILRSGLAARSALWKLAFAFSFGAMSRTQWQPSAAGQELALFFKFLLYD